MKGLSNSAKADLQNVHHLANIILDILQEKPTAEAIKGIESHAKRIKKITQDYNE